MVTQPNKVKSVFDQAVELEAPSDRAALLDRVCAGDSKLRDRVEGLLRAYADAGSFLERPPAAAPTEALPMVSAAADLAGTILASRYKLLETIGEGGMGTVWMAEQSKPVQRRVAVKLIKPGMDSRLALARFEAERQALALMDHPNIAKVLDAGVTPDGRPYFAMELVKGTPITTFCDDKRLCVRERLELFGDVCRAVQHAHQKGIIHRDLKPSNVLVAPYDGRPVVKVIDFGVAKAIGQRLTDATLNTGYGAVVGTPEYMSPEQAEVNNQDIDTRSDIYSLGVLLYELLTGSTPLTAKRVKEAALLEVLQVIREEEPERPSTRLNSTGELPSVAAQRHIEPAKLTRLVRGELDWIVMKALEKDRNRRYETANGFAMDVQRYLVDEPVQACPPSTGYRLRKFARRNRRALVTAGLLAFALLGTVGAVAGSIGWATRDQAARQAAVEQEARRARDEAERWLDREKWPEALAAVKRGQGVLAGGGSGELRDHLHNLRIDLEMILRLEDIGLLATDVKDNWPNWDGVDQGYAQAFIEYGIDVLNLTVDEAATRIRSRDRFAIKLAVSLDDWASLRSSRTAADRDRIRRVAAAVDPDPWRRLVRQAVQSRDGKAIAELAGSPDLARQPRTSLVVLRSALSVHRLKEKSLEVLRLLQRQYPGDFWVNYWLALEVEQGDDSVWFARVAVAIRPKSPAAHWNLAQFLWEQDRFNEAEFYCRKAIELDPTFASPHNVLGNVFFKQAKYGAAMICYRKAIELQPNFGSAYSNIGNVLSEQGKVKEAIAYHRKAIDLDPTYDRPYLNLAGDYDKLGNLGEAIVTYRKALELDPKKASVHNNLGYALFRRGDVDKAIVCYETAIKLDPKFPEVYHNLGLALFKKRMVKEAIVRYQKSIELNPKLAEPHTALGEALWEQEKYAEAEVHCRKGIDLDPEYARTHHILGNVYFKQAKYCDAMACYLRVIELDPKSAEAHSNVGNVLSKLGEVEEAIKYHWKAVELDPIYVQPYLELGALYATLSKWNDAADHFRKAIKLDPNSADAYSQLGSVLAKQGELEEALACHQKAIQLDPMTSGNHDGLGILLCDYKHDYDGAIKAFQKAIELDPKNANAQSNLGTALSRRGRLKEAIVAYRRAIELDPTMVAAHYGLGIVYNKLRQWESAVACFQKVIELEPNHATAYGILGAIFAVQDKLEKAVAALRKAIELDPKNAEAYINLGIVCERKHDYKGAATYFGNAIEHQPKNAIAWAGLGSALRGQNKFDDAIAAFRKAIELDPNNRSAHINLGGILCDQKHDYERAAAAFRKAIELHPRNAIAHTGLGVALGRQNKLVEAIATFRKAIEFDPNLDRAYAGLAWLFATCSDTKFRDPIQAVALAKKAVELAPKAPDNSNTLGAAYYRTGNWKAAIAALEKSIELRKGGESNDWFFLAMAHWQLGDRDGARKWYHQAVEWMDKNQPKNEELRRFRAEAAELLKVEQ